MAKEWNGVALDVVVVERLQFSSKTKKKRINTYKNKIKASAVRTAEEEGKAEHRNYATSKMYIKNV